MTSMQLLETRLDSLTQAERTAAEYLIHHPRSLLSCSLSNLAKVSGTSNSAIIRLTQKLGFAGFSEFRFAVRREMLSPDIGEGSDGDFVPGLLDTYVRYINQLPAYLDMDQQREIAKKIVSAKRLCLWGVSRTYLPVEHLHSRLTRIGILCHATDDSVIMTDQSEILGKGDVCILCTLLGRGNYGNVSLDKMHENAATVILITMNPKIPQAKYADYVVTLPCISLENPTSFYEDQILVYVYNEILLTLISQISGREELPGSPR